jgi:hypothetical protein
VPAHPPLGGYDQFRWSRGGPFPWGDGGRSSVAYGVDVLPDLIAGLRGLPALATEGMPGKAEVRPAVLGCVYRLTSDEVIDALVPLDCCVVVDRQQRARSPLERLNESGHPLSSLYLPGFSDVSRLLPDGSRPVITPGSPMPEPLALGPVRAAGWSQDRAPLVHVKMLVAGRTWVWENDWAQEEFRFTPLRTWMGSANWTAFAPSHLEFGMWSDDPALMDRNQRFLLDVVRFSQPLDSATPGPEPELVHSDWDDEAFAQYAAEWGPDGEPEDEEE